MNSANPVIPPDDNLSFLPNQVAPSDQMSISRIEEQLLVGKQVVETGRVTLSKTVHESEQTVTIPLLSEQYIVERIPVNHYVEEMPATRQEGDTIIYPVVEEVLVVQKKLRLVEEIRVTKQQVSSTHQETVVLRREEVAVERTALPSFPERTDLAGEFTAPASELD